MREFSEALSDLLAQYAETPADEIISELELQLMALKDSAEADDDD